ncbi:TetR/AcrR family transcriptional regulator [Bacillus sp. MRMR6]|uniref:TetR/AcrR family transcriptional regulator n=1 Tax=Bacillus sp. MRMR6 TaxID=1928617 RepID=UPI0009512306|nr:TetR/AcrR family transcriptional regulator [Bacillus sp. MRMR6]OLS41035.1 TetR family transcriptional regulator [Bacillus sp. MRMR6]
MARERKFTTEELFQTVKKILLQHNYEGFTFSLLAEQMEVSRGAIYKYYENKDVLITDFMIYEMEQFLLELKAIEKHSDFEAQFGALMDIIFEKTEIHHLIRAAQQMLLQSNEKEMERKDKLEKLPLEMYKHLEKFITLGKKQGKVKSHIPDGLMLGFILQSIAIPNHFGIPHEEWLTSMKEMISQGMFISK